MTVQRQTLWWLGLLAAFVIALRLLSGILLPFVLGMAIAYFLDPMVVWLEGRGLSRAWASGAISIGSFAVGGLVILVLAPIVVEQTATLVGELPALVTAMQRRSEMLGDLPLVEWAKSTSTSASGNTLTMEAIANKMADVAGGLLGNLLSGVPALLGLLALLAVTPIVAFYLLRDWPYFMRDIDGWLPRAHAETIRARAREIDAVLAGYARGAATVCALLGAFYAVALSLVGLDFGLVIGLAAGAMSFVPYLGTFFGLAASVGVALYQFWPHWAPVFLVLGVFLMGQALGDYVLAPRLVGERIGLHPLWVVFGVLAGGALFGLVGMLLAVPTCAAIGVLVRFAIREYENSSLYLGGDE